MTRTAPYAETAPARQLYELGTATSASAPAGLRLCWAAENAALGALELGELRLAGADAAQVTCTLGETQPYIYNVGCSAN